MSPAILLLIAVAGVAAGFLNTLAGGGTLIAVPALLAAGLPADVANATNRVGVLAQSLAGARGFDKGGRLDRRAALWVVVPSVLGALLGAFVASWVTPDVLRPILIGTLLTITVVLLMSPKTIAAPADSVPVDPRKRPLALVALFGAGIYGGFVQAGMGIVLLTLLGGLLRYDLVRGNALKSLAIAALTAVALVVFIANGKVDWVPGLVLALGTVVGALLAVRFALVRGQRAVMRVVLVAVIGSCALLLFFK